MIIIIEGKLGSGKTYWAVNYLLEKFYSYNESINQFVPKYNDLRIVSNIDELDIEHEDLKKIVESKGLPHAFSEEYIKGSSHCIYVIDEAQYYFDRKYSNKEVFRFFQMSRHWGVDIIMITQDVNTMSRELRNLAETTIKAYPRSKAAKGIMRYAWETEGEKFKDQTLRFKKEVGSMYRSRLKDETIKAPNAWKRYMYIGIGMLIVAVFLLGFLKTVFYPASPHKKEIKPSSDAVSPRARSLGGEQGSPEEIKKDFLRKNPKEVNGQVHSSAISGQSYVGKVYEGQKETTSESENGFKKDIEIEREPLVPARCYEENDGWRVCFEGSKPIGRYKVHNEFKESEKVQKGIVLRDKKYLGNEVTVLK